METLVRDESKDEHYHDAKEHGLIFVLLNKMLHLIVLLFSLFGMIRFKVKFIHMVKLVRIFSTLMIIHSWYMTIKFVFIATIMYFFNQELEAIELPWTAFNCSLENAGKLLFNTTSTQNNVVNEEKMQNLTRISLMGQDHEQQQQFPADLVAAEAGTITTTATRIIKPYTLFLAQLLEHFGGPYKMLGNRATLMYGFYAVAILIMLALFPIELMYLDIGFNYIRFVLNDTGCLRDLFEKRRKHLERLNNWSRNRIESMLTLSMKKVNNRRDLRSSYLFDCQKGPAERMVVNHFDKIRRRTKIVPEDSYPSPVFHLIPHQKQHQDQQPQQQQQQPASPGFHGNGLANIISGAGKVVSLEKIVEEKYRAPLKSLRHSLSTNHLDEPSYSVQVANKNMRKFKPLVRSEIWFMLSMIIYPIFIFFYFLQITFIIWQITKYFNEALESTSKNCFEKDSRSKNLFANWSLFDQTTFFESHYVMFSISLASSFYCSYYFGTILELHMWLEEISQQLSLCKLVLELTNQLPITSMLTILEPSAYGLSMPTHGIDKINPEPDNSPLIEAITEYHQIDSKKIDRCFNQFGGLKCIFGHLSFKFSPQSERLKKREYMACRLVFKKQTILRSTYINLNLFFDELKDTRFMIKTILKRTTQLAFGFALLVGITRSQFKSNYLQLTILMAITLAILNLYLICAASINSTINKLLPQIHGIISASMMSGSDHDLLEFWLRHIQAYGTDKDAMGYKIYGYKITWSSILNFNGAVSSAYLFTIY